MSLILVVEPDTNYAKRIAATLEPDGWDVVLADSREAALRSVATQAPSLLIASGSIPGAKDLLSSFARHGGGPGALVLVPVTLASHISALDFAADDVLTKPFQDTDLRHQVRGFLESPAHPHAAAEESEQLTSADIFGDVLAEVEAEAVGREVLEEFDADFEREIDRKLAETFSGVLGTVAPALPASTPASAQGLGSGVEAEIPLEFSGADLDDDIGDDTGDFDELLEKTLSALEIKPADPLPAPVIAEPTVADPVTTTAAAKAPPSTATPEPSAVVAEQADGSLRFGQYRLLKKIATGGMAEVWKARRSGVEGFEKTVAIKKILSHLTGSPDFVTMFIDEAKLAAQLSHNHIIQIYDLGKVEDAYFIAMEYVEGKDLRSLLTQARTTGRRIPPALAVLIATRLAQALDHAHQQRDFEDRPLGLVHRDVSPQNVLISWQGDIKLCDFGIVKAVVKASNTQMGALKGKLQYMSPEQASGLPIDARSDLFSLGSVLFEMLTGQKLFSADSEMAVLEAVRECRHATPRELVPEIPVEIEQVVLHALAKEPNQRHSSAGELAAELAATLDSLPGQTELASYLTSLFPPASGVSRAAEPESPVLQPIEPQPIEPQPIEPQPSEPPTDDAAETTEPPAKTAEEVVFEPAPELPAAPVELHEEALSTPAEAPTTRRSAALWWIAALLATAAAVAGFFWWKSQPTGTDTPATGAAPTTVPRAVPPEPSAAASAGEPTNVEPTDTGTPQALPEDLEQEVDDQLKARAAELQQSFEAERQRLQRELDAARRDPSAANSGDRAVPPPSDEGGG